jgi:hypothetical protein
MIRVEDNRSITAMANREGLHVAFTRHRATARMVAQEVDVLRKVAQRSVIEEMSAGDLEEAHTESDDGAERYCSRRELCVDGDRAPSAGFLYCFRVGDPRFVS